MVSVCLWVWQGLSVFSMVENFGARHQFPYSYRTMPWYNTVICNHTHCGCGNGCLCLALLQRLSINILKTVWVREEHSFIPVAQSPGTANKVSILTNTDCIRCIHCKQTSILSTQLPACTFVRTTVACIVFMRNGNVLLVDCQLCQPALYCKYVVC